jgi:hypothetical protein
MAIEYLAYLGIPLDNRDGPEFMFGIAIDFLGHGLKRVTEGAMSHVVHQGSGKRNLRTLSVSVTMLLVDVRRKLPRLSTPERFCSGWPE